MRLVSLFVALLLSIGLWPFPASGLEEELRTISTRPGVTQTFLLLRPSGPPQGSVILFTGGTGVLDLSPKRLTQWNPANFLVRNRFRFADHGFWVAVIDAPSDRANTGLADFRATREHAEDIKGVLVELRKVASVPVWLVGTSRGTISAANAAARLHEGGADGLVLTSSVTTPSRKMNESLQHVRLEDIVLPTLVVHHESDGCQVTRYSDAYAMLKRLKRASRKEFMAFKGGDLPQSDPCEALSYHGFLGLDAQVVQAIGEWIKAAPLP